jgi:hypothetical protein
MFTLLESQSTAGVRSTADLALSVLADFLAELLVEFLCAIPEILLH